MLSKILILTLSLFTIQSALAAYPTFTERTPAYFVDRYGYSKTAKNVREINAIQGKHGNIKIKGQFSVREFRSGDLRVKATFALPSLKLVSVWLQLPRKWTPEQIDAALAAYGTDWRKDHSGIAVQSWSNGEGLKAVFLLTSLEIQSPQIVASVDRELSKREAQKKAVPKF